MLIVVDIFRPNNTLWKEFMCHNLGQIYQQSLYSKCNYSWGEISMGSLYWEEGRYISQADDQSNSGVLLAGFPTSKPTNSWSDTTKTENDPVLQVTVCLLLPNGRQL